MYRHGGGGVKAGEEGVNKWFYKWRVLQLGLGTTEKGHDFQSNGQRVNYGHHKKLTTKPSSISLSSPPGTHVHQRRFI